MRRTDSPQDVLLAEDLGLCYGQQHVLRDVNLSFSQGQTVAITGPSGSGKTSLLYCLSGLERPTGGKIMMLGQSLASLNSDALSELRLSRVGFVFQSADLVPELTLRENMALPLELSGGRKSAVRERVGQLLSLLDLEMCADRRPHQVSGGQAQRCAVGRAVATRPAVVFADEPTGALDSVNRDRVLDLLLEQVHECEALLVTVTHDPEIAVRFERRIELVDGLVALDSRGPVLRR